MTKESKLLKNTAIIAIGNLFTKCISFFMIPLYTSLMTTQQSGIVDLISTYTSLLIIVLTLQLEQGIFRFLIDVRDSYEKQKKYISTTILVLSVVNTIITIFMFIILQCFQYKYTIYFILIIISGVGLYVLLQIPRGLGNSMVYATGSCLNGSLCVILNTVFIAGLHWNVKGMLLASILSQGIASIYVILKIKLWEYIDIQKFDKKVLKRLLRFSLPLVPNTLCWWVVNVSDRIIIKAFLSVAANGIYSIACKFPSTFSMVTNIFYTAWSEGAAETAEDQNRQSYYNNIMNAAVKFYSSACMGIIVILPLIFGYLVKNDFRNAYNYIPILMIAALFHSIADLYCSIYTAFKMTKQIAKTTVISAIINAVTNIILVKYIGLYAAAISTFLAYVIIAIYMHMEIKKEVSINYERKFLLREVIVYMIVLYVYYCKNIYVEMMIILPVAFYCFAQNKNIIIALIKKIVMKLKKNKNE